MKKKILLSIICAFLIMPLTALADIPFASNQFIKIELICQKIKTTAGSSGIHRTPPVIPNVYLDQENATLYFENACYDCSIQLVVPGTDNVIYTDVIPNGDNTYVLPNFSGTYELRIIRGYYMFVGEITL